MTDHRPTSGRGHSAVVATLITGGGKGGEGGGGGGRQRVQHRRVSIAEYGEYTEFTAAAAPPSPQPRQHPQQIEVGMRGNAVVGVVWPVASCNDALQNFSNPTFFLGAAYAVPERARGGDDVGQSGEAADDDEGRATGFFGRACRPR